MINDFFPLWTLGKRDHSWTLLFLVGFKSIFLLECLKNVPIDIKAVHVRAETFPVGRNWSGTSNWTELPPEIMYKLYSEITEIIILFGSSGEGPESYGVNLDLSQPLQWFSWNSY